MAWCGLATSSKAALAAVCGNGVTRLALSCSRTTPRFTALLAAKVLSLYYCLVLITLYLSS